MTKSPFLSASKISAERAETFVPAVTSVGNESSATVHVP
jgi:hypothetical protein